jgi:hypothetical protein
VRDEDDRLFAQSEKNGNRKFLATRSSLRTMKFSAKRVPLKLLPQMRQHSVGDDSASRIRITNAGIALRYHICGASSPHEILTSDRFIGQKRWKLCVHFARLRTLKGNSNRLVRGVSSMSVKSKQKDVVLSDTESEFAKTLLNLARKLTEESKDGTPPPFPNGIGSVEIDASIEPLKITLSFKITDTASKFGAMFVPRNLNVVTRSIGSDVLSFCVSLDSNDDPVMSDCNAFVKKVASKFGVTVASNLSADGIVDSFSSSPFTKVTTDPATAMSWANDGLVVAGMRKAELDPTYGTYPNGHVAIVNNVPDTAHPGFPMASWGVLHGRGKSDASIRLSFPSAACDDRVVHFAFAPTS